MTASIIGTCIAQLRANAPVFAGRVAGAAEFYKGLRDYTTSLPMPAAYVLPLGEEAGPNTNAVGLFQIVQFNIGIAVELDAQQDRRGQRPTMDIEAIKDEINSSILNLIIPNCRMTRGIYEVGARPLDLDRARLWYQYEYAADLQFTDADGVQPDSIPLQTIEVDVFLGPTPTPGDLPAAVIQVQTGDPPLPPTNGPWPDPDAGSAA